MLFKKVMKRKGPGNSLWESSHWRFASSLRDNLYQPTNTPSFEIFLMGWHGTQFIFFSIFKKWKSRYVAVINVMNVQCQIIIIYDYNYKFKYNYNHFIR